MVYTELDLIFSAKNPEVESIFNQVTNLIILASPWPGFIKRPHCIDHLEDYSCIAECAIFEPKELFEAFLKDVKLVSPNDKRSSLELLKLYYDDDDYDDDNYHENKIL